MAAENETTAFTCPPKSEYFEKSKYNANSFAYEYLPYFYFVLGILGHSRFLFSCYKQSKTESAYLLQTFFSIVRILEIISFMLLIFGFNRWASSALGGSDLYRSNIVLMWFAAHLIIPLVNGFINTSMLMTLFISLDRALAIGKPHAYRQRWQHKKYRFGALALSLLLGFVVVTYDTGRFYLTYDNKTSLYSLTDDIVYENSNAGVVFTILRNLVDFGGVAGLITCNAVVIRLYRSKMVKTVTSTVKTDRSVADVEREAKRKEAERTLLLLSLCQSVIAMISMGFMILLYMAEYTLSAEQRCSGFLDIGWPMCDAGLQLAAVLDFYVPLFISKPLRRIVFPWIVREGTKTTLNSIQVSSNQLASGVTHK